MFESTVLSTYYCNRRTFCQKKNCYFKWFVVIYDWYLLYKIHVIYNIQNHICGGSCGGSDCAHAWPEVTGRGPVRKSRDCFPYFPVLFTPYFFSRTIFPYFSPRTFSNYFIFVFPYFFIFFPVFFPSTFFPVFFPVLFQKSRRLKSNVLKYQLVVFLVHVVISQFMFLAE